MLPSQVSRIVVWVRGCFYPFSRTLLIHGLESDWIEEEMADDDDFRLSSFPHSYTTFVFFTEKMCWNRN